MPSGMKDETLTARLLTRHLCFSSSSSWSSCKVVMRERVRVRSRVVIRMSRGEQDGIEAGASSIDRDDERLKRDEMRDIAMNGLDGYAWDSFDCGNSLATKFACMAHLLCSSQSRIQVQPQKSWQA